MDGTVLSSKSAMPHFKTKASPFKYGVGGVNNGNVAAKRFIVKYLRRLYAPNHNYGTYMLVPLVLAFAASEWAVLQSDNRASPMVQTSLASYADAASDAGADHLAYSCNAWGWPKPAIVKHVCRNYTYVLWVDTDSIFRSEKKLSDFFYSVEAIFKRRSHISFLTGVDYVRTINKVRTANTKFIDFFNIGIFAVRCAHAQELLGQWEHFTQSEDGDDQVALQIMASPASVWHDQIKYDFELMGVHSSYFNHYAGYKKPEFPINPHAKKIETQSCPFSTKKAPPGALNLYFGVAALIFLIFTCAAVFHPEFRKKGPWSS